MRLFSSLLLSITLFHAVSQGDFLTMKDGAKLYLDEKGDGQAIIFIPGWTMTHRFFEKQKEHFSDQYQFISYDPRGQGRSDKAEYKNTYADHADDLRQILLKKNLDDVILVGWSSGCLTMYEYIRAYGFDRINRLVFIDEPPKWIGDVEKEWVYGEFDDYRSSLKSLISGPGDPDGIIDWMLNEPISNSTRKWMRDEILMTPWSIALKLYIDGLASDYVAEVSGLTSVNPSLFMVRASWYDRVENWLSGRTPTSKVASITSHAMFWERSEEFNDLLSDFLKK